MRPDNRPPRSKVIRTATSTALAALFLIPLTGCEVTDLIDGFSGGGGTLGLVTSIINLVLAIIDVAG
jgi:hypothetical protein